MWAILSDCEEASLFIMFLSICPQSPPGFAEMCFAPLPLQCTFLFFDKLIRAAGLKRLFQMCARTHTRTHTHTHVWVWTPRQADTPFSPLGSSSSSPPLMFCRFQLKRCWPLKNCQQNQSTRASVRSVITKPVWRHERGSAVGFMMYLLIMGNTSLCSDSL